MKIIMQPIGHVRGGRLEATKDHWGGNLREDLRSGRLREPPWARELIKNYW